MLSRPIPLGTPNRPSSALEMLQVYQQALTDLAPTLLGDFDHVLNHLTQLKGTLIFSGVGKSGHIARKLASSFTSTNTPSTFIHPTEAGHGDLGLLRPGDTLFVLSNSGETEELAPLLRRAQELTIPIIGLTAKETSSLAKASTYFLLIPKTKEICPLGLAPTTSTFLMLALGDILMSHLALLKGITPCVYKQYHPSGSLGFKLTTLKDVMRTGAALPVAQSTMAMSDALLIMTQKGVGCLAITQPDGTLEGVISDGDLRRTMAPDFLTKTTADVMTKNPVAIPENMSLDDAVTLMTNQKIHFLLVTDTSHKLIGLATWHDCTSFEQKFRT
jgi:arabinose-5-phosphate isomerase